ncbi:dTDP-4-dehydrorhamnose reductase [Nonlabens sp. YIK11]|nr:dTDP-4-dehydrorhamnose reductase [Nonlabens sp. YIK11]
MVHGLTGCDLVAFNRSELDITCYSTVRQKLYQYKPDYIINCAAYTAVDQAEVEPETAYKINASAVGMLASMAKQIDATLIHFSTDYVFNGSSKTPYKPDDPVNPINTYGRSKWLGERAIVSSGVKHYILRTSWLYAPHGKNFFRWVMENDQEEMKVVDTQVGCPTSAIDVADFIRHLINTDPERYGTYYFCNKGSMTWYAFAKAISEKAGLQKKISRVKTFPSLAERPEYSVLDCSNILSVFDYQISIQEGAMNKVLDAYRELIAS